MHRAGIIGEQRIAAGQFIHELIEGGSPDAVGHRERAIACDGFAGGRIPGHPEKNPLGGLLRLELAHGGGEALGRPAFGRTVFRAGTDTDTRNGAGFARGAREGSPVFSNRRAAKGRELEETIGVVTAGLGSEGRNPPQQPAALVAGISDHMPHAQGAGFERGAQGIGKKNGGVEFFLHPSSERERGFAGFDGNDFIDRGHAAPQSSEFGRREHGDVQVGTSQLACFHRGNTHHGIAQPIARAHEEAERLQVGGGLSGRQIESAPRIAQNERTRCFPAVVHPEPVFGGHGNFAFEGAIEFRGDFLHRFAPRLGGRLDDAAPARGSHGMDGHGNERCAGALRDDSGKGRGGGKASEKRCPQRAVAGMLVDQNGEDAAALDQIDRTEVTFAPVESLQSESAPVAVDEAVEILVALRLENRADRHVAHAADQLRVEFPVADMVDGHDHSLLAIERRPQSGQTDQVDALLHRGLRHAREARDAEKVRPEGVEMEADEPADFPGAHRGAEGNFQIAPHQPPVARQHGPRQQAESSAETEHKRERESSEHGQQRNSQQVNRVIHG